MIRWFIQVSFAFSLVVYSLPISAQETEPHPRVYEKRGQAAAYSARDAAVISMMGWGVGLALGIAILCGSLNQDTSSSSSNTSH